MIQFALYATPGGALLADYSGRVEQATLAQNEHGYAEAGGFVPMGLQEAFQLYDRAGLLHVVFADSASDAIYEGRLEDVQIQSGGVTLRAFGYSRSLSDTPYTALWSATQIAQWSALTATDISATTPDKYNIDFRNRIYVGLQKGTTYTTALDYGIVGFRRPNGSSRSIVGLSFDMILSLPVGWELIISRRDDTWGAGVVIDTILGGVGVTVLNKYYTFTGSGSLTFLIYNNSGAPYANTTENGTFFLNISNVRVVTATTNAVNTTTTANVLAGAAVSVPVVSSARMYVGQRLHMGIPAANGFNATVLSIPVATHFTADLSAAMASGGNVQAFVINADEIAKDLVSVTNALNPTQLRSATGLIQSPSLDLFDERYEDMYPADILDQLITRGDNQATPRQGEWGVAAGRRLYFRAQGSAARTWYVDVSDIDIRRTIDALYNSVYATYQEAGGRTLRSAATTDSASVTRYGLTRRKQINVQTTSTTEVGVRQAATLADSKDAIPRVGLSTDVVFDQNGTRWPLTAVRANDTVVIRNLPPTLSTAIDRMRSFRLTRTEFDVVANTLTLEPESPLPSLPMLLALATPPAWVTTPWWIQIGQK